MANARHNRQRDEGAPLFTVRADGVVMRIAHWVGYGRVCSTFGSLDSTRSLSA